MSDLPVAGPLGELHLGHEARLDPVGAFRERAGRRRVERRGVDLDGLEKSAELAAERIVPPPTGADLSGEPERAAFIIADEDRPTPSREPSGSVNPPTTNSWRLTHLAFRQSSERDPAR